MVKIKERIFSLLLGDYKTTGMLSSFFHTLLLFLVGFLLINIPSAKAQDNRDGIDFKNTVTIRGGKLVSFKDTIYYNGDSTVVRKEVWVKEDDSLCLRIDSLKFQNQSVCFVDSKLFVHRIDTVVVIEDTAITRNARFLKSIKDFSRKKNLFSKLLRGFLVFEDPKPIPGNLESKEKFQTEERYDPFAGKIIRNINIRVLNVFGPSISNPDKKAHGLLEKGANVMHIKTNRWIVKNKLLFRKGDTIDVLKVSESERFLRDNNFIYDARIFVRDTLQNSDSVDVDVLLQDIWSLSGGVGADPSKNKLNLSMDEVNFLGLGQELRGEIKKDPVLPNGYNYNGNYIINNIYKTFLTGILYYKYQNGQTFYGTGVNRGFISNAMKWAGGANVNWSSYPYYLSNEKDSLISVQPTRYVEGDGWLGYGWKINSESSRFKDSRLNIAARVVRTKYFATPLLPDSLPNTYYDRYLYLGSIGVVARKFIRDSYISRLGRTEDIQEGYLLQLTGGLEQRALGNRPYFAVNSGASRYFQWGYLYGGVNMGVFYNNSQKVWENGIFNSQTFYFTPLIKISRWRMRHFVGLRYLSEIRPLKGTYLSINQGLGLRGFNSSRVKGTAKAVFNYEINWYPPLNLLGFKVALIFFTDLAWIGSQKKLIDKRNFFPAYGIGMRFRNDHLIFSTLQLNLAYYPNNSLVGKNNIYAFERSAFYYDFFNYQFNRPFVLSYN